MRSFFFNMALLFAGADARPPSLDGQPFRLVWAQDQGGDDDVYAIRSQSMLMKFDSTVGSEAVLLAKVGSYGNPKLSPDGKWVVYSDRAANAIYKVPFAGGEPEEVASGFAAELWRDPATGEDIVFVAEAPVGYPGLPAWGRIGRKPLHSDEAPAPFWDATGTMANNFQLSANGKVASGQFPWPLGGIAVIAAEIWHPLDRGCWPSLAPDNSYVFWQFDGAHKNLLMQDPITRKKWTVNLNGHPAIGNYEVYHPRWSNHPGFMAFTGPYKVGKGGNLIVGGGPEVEVFVGCFSADLSKLETVHRLTQNGKGDFFPDLWVKGGSEVTSSFPQRGDFESATKKNYSLYFGWESAIADNRGPAGEALKKMHLFDKAYIGPNHEMVFRGRGGHSNPIGNHSQFRRTVSRTLGFTIEGVFTPQRTHQNGRIFSYTQRNNHVNVFIEQEGDGLYLIQNVVGDPVRLRLGTFKAGEPLHLIASVKRKSFRAWVNAKLQEQTLLGLPFWGEGSIIWGEKLGYGAPWEGSVSHIRLIGRQLTYREADRRNQRVAEQLAKRIVPPRCTVKARLLETSSVSAPKDIVPYTNELNAGDFELIEVLDGRFPHKRFAAYGFGILNKKPNREHPQTVGTIYTLELEPYDQQPQLRSELKSNDLESFDLPEFLILP